MSDLPTLTRRGRFPPSPNHDGADHRYGACLHRRLAWCGIRTDLTASSIVGFITTAGERCRAWCVCTRDTLTVCVVTRDGLAEICGRHVDAESLLRQVVDYATCEVAR